MSFNSGLTLLKYILIAGFQARKPVTAIILVSINKYGMDCNPSHYEEQVSNTLATGQLSRRRLLGAGVAVGVSSLAGCTQVANYLAGLVLEDVNLFNETDQQLTGSIRITDPEGSTVLDELFVIEPDDDNEDDDIDEESGETYSDILTVTGSYTIAVELDSTVDGVTTIETSVTIEDPAEEHIMVVFGDDDLEEAIGVLVIEEFTEIGDHIGE